MRQKKLWCYDWGWFLVGHNYTMLISKQGSIDNIFYCSNLQHKVPPFHTSMQIWLSNWLKHNYCLPWALFRYYKSVWGIHTKNRMMQVYCAIFYSVHGSHTIYCAPSDLRSLSSSDLYLFTLILQMKREKSCRTTPNLVVNLSYIYSTTATSLRCSYVL